jgi:hypothetical protein
MMSVRAIRESALYVLLSFLLLTACSSDDTNPTDATTPGESTVITIDSYSGGTVTTPSGYAIEVTKGSVPEAAGGTAAKVAFSIETKIEPPQALPAGIERVGDFVKFGPDGFIFRWPVRVSFPVPAETDLMDIALMFYNLSEEKWITVPLAMIDFENNKIHADVLELGYFALVKFSGFAKLSGETSMGGFEYEGNPGYYYTLTVKSVTFKFPPQAQWFTNLVGFTAASGSSPTGGPRQPTHIILPQGGYEIWITRTKPGTLFTLPKIETYNVAASGTIGRPLKHTQMSVSDWTLLNLPGGGSWVDGRPTNWPTTTTPMGTGDFQATLTWDNRSGSASDLDLHLFGPNDMHVYYFDDVADDGSFELDIDWQETPLGHATENIYSTGTAAKGHYILKAIHYDGARKAYNVRVIRNGTVKTTTGILEYEAEHTILEFDVN